MRSKGALESSAVVQMIVSFVMVLTAIGIAMGFSGIVGTAGGEQSDRDQITELVEKIDDKCSDSNTAIPASVSTSHRIELKSYDYISYNQQDSELVANKTDDTLRFELEGCRYQFEGFPVEKDLKTVWNFDISIASSDPTVIKVNTTR